MDPNVFAVLTGDVIGSGELENYGSSLDDVFSRFETEFEDQLSEDLGVDRFSGDKFQILLSDQQQALRSTLYISTKLASLEDPIPVRISIGVGSIGNIPETRVSNGGGEAFRLSGTPLEQMKNHQRVFLQTSTSILDRNLNEVFRGAMELLSALLIELSPSQAEVVWYKLGGFTQNEIAEATNRTQQTVSDLLIAGHWRNIEAFLTVFEQQYGTIMD